MKNIVIQQAETDFRKRLVNHGGSLVKDWKQMEEPERTIQEIRIEQLRKFLSPLTQ